MKQKRMLQLVPYIVIIICSFGIFLKPLGNSDELWNYNFARNIANGLKPYSDISMVQTPLSAYILAPFIIVFGGGLLSYRIATYVLMVIVAFMLYRLLHNESNSITLSFALTLFSLALHLEMWIYNYNYLSIFLILWIMLIYQKNDQEDYKHEIFIAFLFGLLPLIKQNTGFFLLLAFYAINVIEIIYEKNSKKKAVCKVLISLLPGAFYMVYLIISGTFADFWEYAILGITSFTHRITFWTFAFSSPLFFVFSLIPLGVFGYAIYYFYKYGYNSYKIKCTVISLSWMSVIFPLCDNYHFLSALIPLTPLFLMFVNKKRISLEESVVCNFVAIITMIFAIDNSTAFSDEYILGDLNHYEYIPISRSVEEEIKIVDEYIADMKGEGYDVYIVSEYSVVFTIPLDRYTKNWDMLLVGNIGSNTIQDLLSTNSPSIYLVLRDDSAYGMQAHHELVNYVKENYICIDEVSVFDVYKEN